MRGTNTFLLIERCRCGIDPVRPAIFPRPRRRDGIAATATRISIE
jgi:hypothetical protein